MAKSTKKHITIKADNQIRNSHKTKNKMVNTLLFLISLS